MKKNTTSIHWFRQDLRLSDNPALNASAKNGTVIPIYILDTKNTAERPVGGASRVWLHHSLKSLNDSLNGSLRCFKGDPLEILERLIAEEKPQSLTWNRLYDASSIARDSNIKTKLGKTGLTVLSFGGSLLWEPWETLKADGTPYKVFTPFYRRGCLNASPPRSPEPPTSIKFVQNDSKGETHIDGLNLLTNKYWEKLVINDWRVGEIGAKERLTEFVKNEIADYKEGRNFPVKANVSRLSPYLHWGEISPNTVWYAAKQKIEFNPHLEKDIGHFLSELGWREFSNSLLYHFPGLPKTNLQSKFDSFPWTTDECLLRAWQTGQTGYPIVDAGMRQLWQTGYMHNRLRMIVGSFLVKNLLLHWHHGESWFWDCLFDADLANNSAGWQWIAGCGADAAPYFRIFNPITQGKKFDPDGVFVRRFIPELENLPNSFLFTPWEASTELLDKCKVKLGETYPKPIVDLKVSRERALGAFSSLKSAIT